MHNLPVIAFVPLQSMLSTRNSKRQSVYWNVPGIYRIMCTLTGGSYIGQAINILQRWNDHVTELRHNTHTVLLQRNWNKYGAENFVFEVLEVVDVPTAELMDAREAHWMAHFNSLDSDFGYNLCPAGGSCLGYKHTDEARQNMSNASPLKGTTVSDERKQSNSEAMTAYMDQPEVKRSNAEAMKKRWEDPLFRANFASKMKGRQFSKEHKEKLSITHMGKQHTEAEKQHLSQLHMGKTKSAETRRRMSEGRKKSWALKRNKRVSSQLQSNLH